MKRNFIIRILNFKAAVAALMMLCALPGWSQASQAFIDAPVNVFPLLDRNTRLDMIDYFTSNMTTPSPNQIGGKSRIILMEPERLKIEMTESSDYQVLLLPTAGGRDSMIAVVTTVKTPAEDSRLDFYNREWTKLPTERFIKRPGVADWLTTEGKANEGEVTTFVPFMLVSLSYDPVQKRLTLTNNTRSFLTDDIYEMVNGYLKETLVYEWNGKEFKRVD